jgi:predicted alpha-1,2-mannosidase
MAGGHPSVYVNPFIGARTNDGTAENNGPGKTFPGAATPFGMVQVSPNTITGGDNGSGYSYEHTSIEGFAFTQMSGVGWYGDLGNFLVMPSEGPLKTIPGRMDHPGEGYRSDYIKSSEKASAGYYSVMLSGSHIRTEMTATPHSGILRFTFPASERSRIQIDLARRVGGTATQEYIEVIDDHSIRGWMKCTPEGGGWGDGDGKGDYTVYFYAEFSKPLRQVGAWSADIPDDWGRKREDIESDRYRERVAAARVLRGRAADSALRGGAARGGPGRGGAGLEGKHLGFFTEFATGDGEQVILKAGISFVSMEGARQNLETEIGGWNFDKVHAQAVALWDKALGKIDVEGGTAEEKKVFYTALYHTMIDPRTLEDVDGSYPGGDGKIHQSGPGAAAFTKRTIFSGWDVFRSQFPLQTIINPHVVNDMINSLVQLADESGQHYLERWEFLNAYSGCMVGNPAVAVMADAYAKGIRGFDTNKGYLYARNTCERFGNGKEGYSYGEAGISKTLEYAYSDWCLSKLAGDLGKKEDQALYAGKAGAYRNTFDDSVGWFRLRKQDGSWEPWPKRGRLQQDYGTVESNPYQQGWFVPQDVDGMVKLMGGREKVAADLENFFGRTPDNMLWNDYYNHSNEPVHHVAFLFNRIGYPWLTQKWTRAICRRAYHNTVEGLVGNEDVGQMSAWYVLAATGIHPVCPGETRYEITSPVFSRIVIRLDPAYARAKTFTIIAHHNSPENIYIQSALLNGKPYEKCWLDHSDIMAGGVLELTMGKAATHWGVGPGAQSWPTGGKLQAQPSTRQAEEVRSIGPVQPPLVWDTPGKNLHDAIPLGNGDIGISAWTEQDGGLRFFISKTDAYDDDNRLVKVAKVLVKISPNPFVMGRPYREVLNLRQGELTIRSGAGADQVDIRIWVDANNPAVRLSVAGQKAFRLSVALEDNRKEARLLQDTSFSDPFSNSIDGSLSTIPAMSYPDSIMDNGRDNPANNGHDRLVNTRADRMMNARADRIIWYHHNTHSCWPAVLRLQGLDDWVRTHADPLQDRIFGGCISGKGLVRADDTTLVAAPALERSVSLTLLTAQPATSAAWLHRLDSASSRIERQDPQVAIRAHRDWWERFWDRSWIKVSTKGDTGDIISRGYALQRWLIACGGRGKYWTKFNGSIFTLPWENADPDYRRWGSANWFQNVRLLYWPLIAAGDFDLLAPFFGQYLAALPLATARTAAYYGHGGAFFSETSYAWGTYSSGDYGFDRTDKPPGFVTSTYMRHYWSGGLELSAMMLDQYAVTRSRSFLADTLLPIAGAVVRFYDQHWRRGPDGKIRFDTAQSLETWQTAVNPTPEIAGLKYVLVRLLELPSGLVTAEQRAAWTRTLADLPAVPSQTRNDSVYLKPADSFGDKNNSEDPELYAVFPYRLYDIGQPSLQTGLNTFAVREFRDEDRCWWQDEIQAACLGLAHVAADGLDKRFRAWNRDFRFPAMWGPNNDEIPDLDHGGAGQIALQYMLMQSDGEKIYLFPAWPSTWDASFKLHAPGGTVIRGELRQGRLQSLEVTPETRRKDVVILPLQ